MYIEEYTSLATRIKPVFNLIVLAGHVDLFFVYKGKIKMHNLNQSSKKRIKNDVISGARLYKKYLVPNEFLVITEDGDSVVVCFHKEDFAHLAGVRNVFSDLDFYNHCALGTLTEENIKTEQHYDFGTIRKKIIRIKKINKIIYANADTNLVLVNLHTHTRDFPIAIESPEDKMVVAFIGDDFHARSLRNNNQTNADEKKNIIAIFSREKRSEDKYEQLVYINDYEYFKNIYTKFDEVISVNILKEYDEHNLK